MNVDAGFITSIIVLITSIVGLYTAIVSIKGHKTVSEETRSEFDDFVYFLFSVAKILIVPAVMLGFIWIFNISSSLMGSSATDVGGKYKVPNEVLASEKMYLISEQFWNQDMRQKALKKTIERAFLDGNYEVILKAAKELNPTSQTDPVLMRAIDMLAENEPQESSVGKSNASDEDLSEVKQ